MCVTDVEVVAICLNSTTSRMVYVLNVVVRVLFLMTRFNVTPSTNNMELAGEKHMEALDCYRNMAVVLEDDYNDAVIDDEGVIYSKDGKRLLKGAESIDYVVRDGTEVICNGAFEFENVRNVKFPKSLRYIV